MFDKANRRLLVEAKETKDQLKIKIDEKEYLVESLPDQGKQLVTGLRTADIQTNMYEDTLRLIAISKTKMIEDLKVILKEVEPLSGD